MSEIQVCTRCKVEIESQHPKWCPQCGIHMTRKAFLEQHAKEMARTRELVAETKPTPPTGQMSLFG